MSGPFSAQIQRALASLGLVPGSAGQFSVPVLLPDGGASAPSLAFANETNTGLFRPGASNIRFVVGGSAYLDLVGGNIQIDNGRNVVWAVDNNTDLGTASNRPANVRAGTAVIAPTVQITTALIATGGGSGTPAFVASSTGGTGQPTTATQNGWCKLTDSTGATFWVPVWK